MIPRTQGELERAYLAIMYFNPTKVEENQPLQLFEFPSHQRIIRMLKEAYDPETQTYNEAALMKNATDYVELTDIMEMFVFDSQLEGQYEHFRSTLFDNMKVRTLGEYMDRLEKMEISLETFVEKVEAAVKMRDSLPRQKTPQELAEMITSRKRHLRFNRFANFNKCMPIQENTLTTIAAYTSRGKSAFALNLAHDLAKQGYKVIYFNLEMTEEDVWKRLAAIDLQLGINNIQKIEKGSKQYQELLDSLDYGDRLTIVNGTKSAMDIRAMVIKEKEKPIVFVDHISYLTGRSDLKERERISESMKTLNALAKDGRATVFALAQINRQGEDKGTLSNLYGSSAIEQDSDNVLILEPEEDELQPNGSAKPDLKMIAKAQKVRGGVKGNLPYLFRKPTQTFVERV